MHNLINDEDLIQNMRKVWEQHIYWTRMVLISIAEKLRDLNTTNARLMQNPHDIGKIFAKHYNSKDVKKIEQLFTEHLQIGGEIITALRDGDNEKAKALDVKWHKNADEIALAFSQMNPYYKYSDIQQMMYSHLALTNDEVKKRIAKKYSEDIKAFDKVEIEALKMADEFSNGIMNQFPHKFH